MLSFRFLNIFFHKKVKLIYNDRYSLKWPSLILKNREFNFSIVWSFILHWVENDGQGRFQKQLFFQKISYDRINMFFLFSIA